MHAGIARGLAAPKPCQPASSASQPCHPPANFLSSTSWDSLASTVGRGSLMREAMWATSTREKGSISLQAGRRAGRQGPCSRG